MGSEINRQMRDGIIKWEIVNPDDLDQDNGAKLLNYCIANGFGQAKARVAPLKDISISRLELLACTIGARLAASVNNDLNLPGVLIYYLTDSMCVTALSWIQRTRDWSVFVFNRVKEIRNLSDVSS
ncbi:integrase catalytic domain-containing protein [Trichonephila clavipes]|nr:integrase catalytic domain-containing protein [Trichonephila clavipes]